MREILFKGKRVDNGEWIEGFLFITRKGQYNIKWYDPHYGSSKTSAVIPESVGQHTELKDKNGQRIFEGDVVRVDLEEPTLACLIGEVFFTNGCYMIRPVSSAISLYAYHPCCTVIGNIHDNPELLQGG